MLCVVSQFTRFLFLFADVAIGAPMEVDGENRGAIYIYLGSRNGLVEQAAQRIVPSQLTNRLVKGFGYSLGFWWDIDQNGFSGEWRDTGSWFSHVVPMYACPFLCICASVCVCVCVRERRKIELTVWGEKCPLPSTGCVCVCACVCVCVCVCVRERRKIELTVWGEKVPIALNGMCVRVCVCLCVCIRARAQACMKSRRHFLTVFFFMKVSCCLNEHVLSCWIVITCSLLLGSHDMFSLAG